MQESTGPDPAEELTAALGELDQGTRYRLLASVFERLGDTVPSANGLPDQELGIALRRAHETEAELRDRVAELESDVTHRTKQLDAERNRAADLERLLGDQRTRLDAARLAKSDIELKLQVRDRQLQDLQLNKDALAVSVLRAEKKAQDRTVIDTVTKQRNDLAKQVKRLQAEVDKTRKKYQSDTSTLKRAVVGERGARLKEVEALLGKLWERLSQAKPPLAPPNAQPTPRASGRLVDAFIELVMSTHYQDQALRPFIGKFAKQHAGLRSKWDTFTNQESLCQAVRSTVAPQKGRPVGTLKVRMKSMRSWTMAGLLGVDSALESVGSELAAWIRQPNGHPWTEKTKIRDFLKQDGAELFLQHMRGVCSQKVAEAYGS
jgi:hypothetical protein